MCTLPVLQSHAHWKLDGKFQTVHHLARVSVKQQISKPPAPLENMALTGLNLQHRLMFCLVDHVCSTSHVAPFSASAGACMNCSRIFGFVDMSMLVFSL